MHNEIIRKLDVLMGNMDKLERGKSTKTPNSSINTPILTGVDKNLTHEGPRPSGSNSGIPELVFGSFESVNQGRRRFEYKNRKVDMPTFDGRDPDGWILQAERYFAIYQLINEEKIEAAVLSLNGDALAWFRWASKRQMISSWEDMKTVFLKRSRLIHGGNLYEKWSALRQTDTTEEYVRKFIELSAPLDGVTEQVALGKFIDGIQSPIKTELRMWEPENLGQAFHLA